MKTKENKKANKVTTDIEDCRQKTQEISITLDDIKAEKKSKEKTKKEVLSDEEVKASVEKINPDANTLDRG